MKRKIAVILAADVAGFSRLVAEDEEETLRRLASYRSVFSDFISSAGGRIFNTAGDSILAEFQSAVDAVRCAIDVQESLRTRNQAYQPSRQMKFRMGLTIGDVVERDGDLLGDGVNIAARLQSIAPEGGICISRSIHEAVANKLSVKFLDKGMQQLKNIPEPMQAFTVGPSVSGSDADPALGNSATSSKLMLRSKMRSSGRVLAIAAICVASIAAIAMFTLHKPEIASPDERQKVAAAPPAPVEATSPKDAKDLEKVLSPPSDKSEQDEAKPVVLPSADPAASETPSAVVKAPAAYHHQIEAEPQEFGLTPLICPD